MKILFCTHLYLPDHRAGVETYTAQLASGFRGRAEVAVATTKKVISQPTGWIRKYSLAHVPVFEVCNNLSFDGFSETWKNPAMAAAFAQILAEFRPDVVHFQHLMYWSLDLPAIARAHGAQTFHTLHDFWLICPRQGQLVNHQGELCRLPSVDRCSPCMASTTFSQSAQARRWIERLIRVRRITGLALDRPFRRAEAWRQRFRGQRSDSADKEEPGLATPDLDFWAQHYDGRRAAVAAMAEHIDSFISPSLSLRDRFREIDALASTPFAHLPQGREHAAFAGLQKQPRQQPLRLGYIGTVAPHKGLASLVGAVQKLAQEQAVLAIYGPSHQHAEYAAEICQSLHDKDQIQWRGAVSPAEVPALYRELDLLCVPSLWDECCPLTIQEAFMARTPVLASDLGGMAELLASGRGGRLLPPGDEAAWAEAITELASDAQAYAELSASIPQVVTMAEHLDALWQIYRGS